MFVAATIHHGEIPLILSGPKSSRGARGALDSANYEVLARRGDWETDCDTLGFQYDQPISGFHSLWVQTMAEEEENDLHTLVTINCIGLLKAGEKRRRRLSVNGREIALGPFEETILSWIDDEQGETLEGVPVDQVKRRVPKLETSGADIGEPVYKLISTPYGTSYRVNIRDVVLVVTDTYFTTDSPDTAAIGTPVTPPLPPPTPAYIWGSYDGDLRGNAPYGWVLDDRQIDEHFSNGTTGLWEVTDVFGYYQTNTPD